MPTRTLFALTVLLLTPVQAKAGSCTVSVTNLAFGSYNVFNAAPAASTGSISHSCKWQGWEVNEGRTYRISISPGQSGSFAARTLRNGAESLVYNVFMDASATRIWGDGSGGTSEYTATATVGNGEAPGLTMYGVIPAGQDVSAGAYTDTLNVVITY